MFLEENDEKECLKKEEFYSELSVRGFVEETGGFIVCEVFFVLFLVLLTVSEIRQIFVLRLQYVKELENYVEWIVILSATFTIAMKQNAVNLEGANSAVLRGLAAVGIAAAWLQLIFIIGRYPFRGGDFSIMFYNIIKRTFRYIIAMAFMIFGFACAFMVVNFGNQDGNRKDIFQNPFKSSMMTLTMALGEYNFEDMYDNFGSDSISRGFAMFLLLLLIILGSITMVNLFVAVIISDLDRLREDVFSQNLVHMAQCAILVEALLPASLLKLCRVKEAVVLCGHSLCPSSCQGERLREGPRVKEDAKMVLKRMSDQSV